MLLQLAHRFGDLAPHDRAREHQDLGPGQPGHHAAGGAFGALFKLYGSRFQLPYIGSVATLTYYLEARYKLTSALFVAMRWNQQFFEQIPDDEGRDRAWDRDLLRLDNAVGYRFNRYLQAKLQYSYSHQKGDLQQGEQLVAAQLTLKF